MTVLPIYGGPTKRDLVQMARAETGQADYNYQIEPEEYDSDIRSLNAVMGQLLAQGIDLGYNFPTSNIGSPNDESGIPHSATQAIALMLAFRIAPSIGRQMPAESKAALVEARALLHGQYAKIPQSHMRSTTPRGAGNRRFGWPGRNYYPPSDTSDDTYGFPSDGE